MSGDQVGAGPGARELACIPIGVVILVGGWALAGPDGGARSPAVCEHSLVHRTANGTRLACVEAGASWSDVLGPSASGCEAPSDATKPRPGIRVHTHRPSPGESLIGVEQLPGPTVLTLGGKIDLNRAQASDLVALDGIGPTLAERIVDWRRTEGAFSSVEDLLAVRGIGERTLERLRPQLFLP